MDLPLPAAEPSPRTARVLGLAVLGLAGMAVLAAMGRRSGSAEAGGGNEARTLRHSAALLAASVLADSTVEHYRGAFENPGMYAPLLASTAVLLADAAATEAGGRPARDMLHGAAVAVGAAGAGFHGYNVLRRLGGLGWNNLFYGAPLGAPAALALAGLLGLGADRVATGELMGLPAGKALAGLVAVGLVGTVGEVWLLHFRGAFHNPAMWLPVVVPPVAAGMLVSVALGGGHVAAANGWLLGTALLGIGGVGFHVYGVGRHMGGWRNWRQNLLDGPPVPAPPSFTALSLAGLAALSLIGRDDG